MIYSRYIKRILDIFLALLLLMPVLIVIALISPFVYLEDHGPIFYNAYRIGQFGRFFKLYKIRSMKVNAPDIRLKDGSTYNGEDDPRVTKIGKFIRETSIDELPQIFNVLKGDMSFIGPRPDPTDWLEKYPEDVKIFLDVKPGITGYSQAYFRNSADGYEKMKNDVYYAKNISFILDLKILFKTVGVVLRSENMYKAEEDIQNESD